MRELRVSIPTVDRLAPGEVVVALRPKNDPLLSAKEVAARLGVLPSSWRSMVVRGYAPEADVPAVAGAADRRARVPRWFGSTIARFERTRPGQGFRSDRRVG